MKKIYSHAFILVFLGLILKVNAQPTWFWQPSPSGPYSENQNLQYSNWEKQDGTNGTTDLSDDFSSSLDLTKWSPVDRSPCCCEPFCTPTPPWCNNNGQPNACPKCAGANWSPHTWFQPQNLSIQYDSQVGSDVISMVHDLCDTTTVCLDGILGHGCAFDSNPFSYQFYWTSGGIVSKNASYDYGYYEANIKLPGWNLPNGQPTADGFTPGFWLYWDGTCDKDELDILEADNNGGYWNNGNAIESGVWDQRPTCLTNGNPGCSDPDCGAYFCPTDPHSSLPSDAWDAYKFIRAEAISASTLFSGYHNYAVEYLSDRIIFYLDQQPYAWSLYTNCPAESLITHSLAMQPMTLVINNGILHMPGCLDANNNCTDKFNDGNPVPNNPTTWGGPETTMSTDYFYYWKLKKDCSTASVIYNNNDLTGFQFKVKQSITFDGSVIIPVTGNMNNLTFRATDAIHIKPGFGAPSGCTLHLMINPCN